jgi:hypothetical protein
MLIFCLPQVADEKLLDEFRLNLGRLSFGRFVFNPGYCRFSSLLPVHDEDLASQEMICAGHLEAVQLKEMNGRLLSYSRFSP